MNKSLFPFVVLTWLLLLSGCAGAPAAGSPADMPDIQNLQPSANGDRLIFPTEEIEELESGLSAVRFDGDYAFDLFLEQGGADSDMGVVQFLGAAMPHGDPGLQMGGDMFGCSTISVASADGGFLFGRNFDWQACNALVVMTSPEQGYASIATVNIDFIRQGAGPLSGLLTDDMLSLAAVYAPLDGMNEKGLCVSVNMIQDRATIQQNTDKPDITTTTAIRLMLDKSATVGEALELLAQYDMHASMNYMIHFAIADNTGRSVAVEYVDNEMIIIETPILTNFYLAEGEKQGIGTQQSHTRFNILAQALDENPDMNARTVRDVLDSVSKDNFGEFESTEWSVVFDQSALTATYYHRENYEVGYHFQLIE